MPDEPTSIEEFRIRKAVKGEALTGGIVRFLDPCAKCGNLITGVPTAVFGVGLVCQSCATPTG